jgi:hypothetical protein
MPALVQFQQNKCDEENLLFNDKRFCSYSQQDDKEKSYRGGGTHSHEQRQTEMALYVPSQVLGKITEQILFINTSSFLPFVMFVSPNPLSQILREQTV